MGSLSIWTWVALLGFVAWIAWPRRSRNNPKADVVSRPTTAPYPNHADFTWPTLDTFDFEVVGESHYQPVLQALMGDGSDPSIDGLGTAILIPDDRNPHDDQAVLVTISGFPVGHLSRDDARHYRRRLKTKAGRLVPAGCGCQIVGGHELRDGSLASYGVMLDMKPFD